VRYARNAAIIEEDPTLGIASPTVAWADTAFTRCAASALGLSLANSPAGPDAGRQQRRIVSTSAIEEFRLSSARRLASGHRRLEA